MTEVAVSRNIPRKRKTWRINPVQRSKPSAKNYDRKRSSRNTPESNDAGR